MSGSTEPPLAPLLEIALGTLRLKNPILAASGTAGHGIELAPFFPLDRLGAVVCKTVTESPREGNPPPRVFETPAGLLNSIGLQNPGIERWCAEVLPQARATGATLIANVAGETVAGFAALVSRLDREEGVAAIEINLSCPNVSGGLDFAQNAPACAEVVRACRRATGRPLLAKLTPNAGDVPSVARAAEQAGADAVTVANTFLGLAVDWRRRRPRLPRGPGGLSGPAIRPLAVRLVADVARAVRIPVIGVGGIASGEDALEFLCAGARAVQVGTATFRDPTACARVLDEMTELLRAEGVRDVNDLVGTLVMP